MPTDDELEATRLRLRDLVHAHRVCFEVTTDLSAFTGELKPVGFAVSVFATDEDPTHEPSPGCELCVPVEATLHKIIDYVLPSATDRTTHFDVGFSHAISYDHKRHARPDRTAMIEILHRNGVNEPIDDCERRCRDEIVRRLKSLGACERSWSEPAA